MPGARIDYESEIGTVRAGEIVRDKKRTCHTSHLGCWEFVGSRNSDGYGQVWTKKNSNMEMEGRGAQSAFLLHIVAYLAANGDAGGQHVSHLCDNPSCFNPAHLIAESPAANNARKGCWGGILCPDHGHPIVTFCSHTPKCIRPPMTAQHVECCLTKREIAIEHSSQQSLRAVFVERDGDVDSSRPGTSSSVAAGLNVKDG